VRANFQEYHMDKSKETAIHGEMPRPPKEKEEMTMLGEYLLNSQPIYSSIWGNIYQASKPNDTQSSFAVKVYNPEHMKSSWKSFEKEALLLQKLKDPSLPKILSFGKTKKSKNNIPEGTRYLVMDFVRGTTFSQRDYKNTAIDLVFRWALEIVEGLLYLHNHKIIHRDLTPNNILILSTPQEGRSIKLIDFGISLADSKQVGTLRYMSPEQLEGKNVTSACDVYAFGIIFYELFYNEYPYNVPNNRQDTIATWQKIHKQASIARYPKNHNSKMPDIEKIIHKCLEKDPGKRPTTKEIVTILRKEISGVGNPSYIAIVGARSSGKTCFLTSLYKQVEPLPETSKILGKNCINLYEKGIMPSATALAFFRLEFFIHSGGTSHHVVTRDYGGELLQQDYAEKLQKQGANTTFFQQKREELYEFFQSARAILIMIETKPSEKNLQQILNYRSEIFSIIQKLAKVKFNKRRTQIPIAIVLTKWDRMGNISWDPKTEMKRASQYVQETDWLKNIYEQLRAMCPMTNVFPIFSFIGDTPSLDNIRSFNLTEPLIWSHLQGQECLAVQCKEFASNHPQSYSNILENYWRLIHVEKIDNIEIIKKIKQYIHKYAQEYYESLLKNIAKENDHRWVIGECQQFLEAKGITPEQKRSIERKLQTWKNKKQKQHFWKITVPIVMICLLIYSAWEWIAYSRVQQAVIEFQETNDLNGFCQELYNYRKYKHFSVVRIFLEEKITQPVEEKLKKVINQKLDVYEQIVGVEPPLIKQETNFGKDISVIKSEQSNAEQNLQQCSHYIAELSKVQHWKQNVLENIGNERLQNFSVELKLAKWQEKRTIWSKYLSFLKIAQTTLKEGLDIEKEAKEIILVATPVSKTSYTKLNTAVHTIRQNKSRVESWQEKNKRYLQKDTSALAIESDLKNLQLQIDSLHQKLEDLVNLFAASQHYEELKKYQKNKEHWKPSNISNISKLKKKEQSLRQYLQKFRTSVKYLQHTTLLNKNTVEIWQQDFAITIQEIQDTLGQYHYQILHIKIAQTSLEGEILDTDRTDTIKAKQEVILRQLDEIEKWQREIDILDITHKKKLILSKELAKRKRNLDSYFIKSNKIYDIRVKEQHYKTYYGKMEDLWVETQDVAFSKNDSLYTLKNKKASLEEIVRRWDNFSLHSKDFLSKNYSTLNKNKYIYLQKTMEKQKELEKIIVGKIQEENYQKQMEELSKIEQEGLMNIDFFGETFSSLKSKKNIIKESIDDAENWRISKTVNRSFSKKLQEKKQQLLRELELHQQYSEKSLRELQSLKNNIENIVKNTSIQSYASKIEELNSALQKIQKNNFLNRVYKDRLQAILTDMNKRSIADKKEYKDIMMLEKSSKYIDMYHKILEYKKSTSHNQIMKKNLDSYLQGWSCKIDTSVNIITSIDDSGAPSILLEIYTPKKFTLSGDTTLYMEGWYSKKLGSFAITPGISVGVYKIKIHVWESDYFGDDDHGQCTIDIVKLINNETVKYEYIPSKTETVKFTFTPTIKETPSFPKFKGK
jgi:hypothetical protein